MGGLQEELAALALYDHHAHPLLREEALAAGPYASFFSEAVDPDLLAHHAPATLSFRRALRELAAAWGCPPEPGALAELRAALGYREWSRRLVNAARIEAVLLDDGYPPAADCQPLAWHAALPWAVGRVVRAEAELEATFPKSRDARDLLARFEARLATAAAAPAAFAVKSILAYRSGLAVETWGETELERAYREVRRQWGEGRPQRLTAKPLLDEAFRRALAVARATGRPLQVHTGFGDPDLDLRLANPLHLRPFFEDPAWRSVPFVLLHAYPYVREAGYLAAV